ncbi:MAG TPA: PDR/VanB family oxidoreductase [Burkholderiaceae bacterium]|nr:PDR/VanB family oxidoreductase [Burkholderiaceae bacterium]
MLPLRVRSVTWEAQDILSFELVDPAGAPLPAVEAGAHLDVRVPGGLMRRYSLCQAPSRRDHWRIAVLAVAGGRGGSRAMHRDVRAGQIIEVAGPHNFFPLNRQARHTVLLAGGIGITPLLAMAEQLAEDGASWELHVCTRSAERTPFARRMTAPPFEGRVRLHHDGGDPAKGLALAGLLAEPRAGTHLYYCGPAGFMQAAKAASAHWPAGTVHFEYFGAEPAAASAGTPSGEGGTSIVLKKSGRTIPAALDATVLQALRAAGVEIPTSCEAGVCSTCATDWLEGEPEHHDQVLDDAERAHRLLVCCARPGPRPLVLDL